MTYRSEGSVQYGCPDCPVHLFIVNEHFAMPNANIKHQQVVTIFAQDQQPLAVLLQAKTTSSSPAHLLV